MTLLSLGFLIFLSIVIILYWTVFKHSARCQNILLFISSLLFYSIADWHFTVLLMFSILFNFYLTQFIAGNRRGGRYLLVTGVSVNVFILAYFKYRGFFYDSWMHVFGRQGETYEYNSLHIILPLGISFYTFQAIGYMVDVYNERIEACDRLLNFATYLAYFPKMTAGPIEPANLFIEQIGRKREFNYQVAVDGLRQILWGAFAKLVIADNCALIAAPIFENFHHLPASTLLIGAFFYLFQVYCDFSGYSNMALGISKLFGIKLMRNFASPFFSTNISEYWKKWNISLSSWMMKYVFYPLSFTLRKYGKPGLIFSILMTFLIIGLWHGANGTFILFGLLHGLYFIPVILYGKIKKDVVGAKNMSLPTLRDFIRMMGIFMLVMLTIIVFGADSVSQAFLYLGRLISFSIFRTPFFPEGVGYTRATITLFFILVLMYVEWVQRGKNHEMQIDSIKSRTLRVGVYYALVLSIFLCGADSHLDFIYSQF